MVAVENALDRTLIERRISTTLDCSLLMPIEPTQNLYDCIAVKQFIQSLPFQSPPAVYMFSLLSEHTATSILSAIQEADKDEQRKYPYVPMTANPSKTLYVGQVKKDLRGRMICHLGYNNRPGNHGLQLCHWARQLGLKLKIDCLIMHPEAMDQLLLWESTIAKTLQPLIGRY